MAEALHVYISGQVQGVGFRWAARSRARALDLNGWVRNLPDGRVEGEFEGERPALESMLAWCRVGPLGAGVREVDYCWKEVEGLASFQILHS